MLKFKRLAIIPARGGSKRIKNKNLVEFYGKPIIYYTINNARKSKLFDKIHISTDSNLIINFLKKIKIEPEFFRPNYLAGDKTSIAEVLKFVVREYEKKNYFFKEIWLLYSCAPLINHIDLKLASKKYNKTKKKYPMMSIQNMMLQQNGHIEKKKTY